jgi:hypothetical protein
VQRLTGVKPPAQAAESDAVHSPSPVFQIQLQARPGIDGIRDLRGFLKLALRRFQLRCIDLRELPPDQHVGAPRPKEASP